MSQYADFRQQIGEPSELNLVAVFTGLSSGFLPKPTRISEPIFTMLLHNLSNSS
jgi:hypothetical protein